MGGGSALAAFLEEARQTPFAPGLRDCALFAADWVRQATGSDPAAAWRERYTDEDQADRLLMAAGGMEAVFARELAHLGLPETSAPAAGDVGLIRTITDRGRRAVGAICAGPRWVTLAPSGLVAGHVQPIAAWRVDVQNPRGDC